MLQPPAQRSFSLEGAANLAARLPGSGGETKPVILLVAHFDHLGSGPEGVFPGADDNASGVAVLLELARQLRGRELPCELRFLLSDGEE